MTLLSRFCCLCLLCFAGPSVATGNEWRSAATRATLIELYTSEGCSSCPAAGAWLGALTAHDQLWRQLIPVAFHVDYWNYLGWEDSFSQPAFSARQRSYKQQGGSKAVYTPGFIVNGREWRGFFSRASLPTAAGDKVGVLSANWSKSEQRLRVQFQPAAALSGPLVLYVALLGMGIEQRVAAGENRGRRLEHDFVVLELRRQSGSARGADYRWELPLDLASVSHQPPEAIALWVTESGQLQPLQATGGRLE